MTALSLSLPTGQTLVLTGSLPDDAERLQRHLFAAGTLEYALIGFQRDLQFREIILSAVPGLSVVHLLEYPQHVDEITAARRVLQNFWAPSYRSECLILAPWKYVAFMAAIRGVSQRYPRPDEVMGPLESHGQLNTVAWLAHSMFKAPLVRETLDAIAAGLAAILALPFAETPDMRDAAREVAQHAVAELTMIVQ